MPSTQLVGNYDISQIFLGDNVYEYYTWTNTSGGTLTLKPGTLMGQILSSAKLLPNLSSSTDGTELPMSVLADTYTVANNGSATVCVCIGGRVNQNALIFGSGDTLSTAVRTVTTGGGTIHALINRNTGILLVPSQELTVQDPNQ